MFYRREYRNVLITKIVEYVDSRFVVVSNAKAGALRATGRAGSAVRLRGRSPTPPSGRFRSVSRPVRSCVAHLSPPRRGGPTRRFDADCGLGHCACPHVIELRGGHACGSPDRERSRQRGARRPAQVQWPLRWLRRLRLRQLTLLCLTLVAGRQPFSGGAGTGYQKGSTAAATLPVPRGGLHDRIVQRAET